MGQRHKKVENASPRSSKQRHDSGYAPLASNEKNENIRALSLVKKRITEHVPEHARWICIPLTQLLSWKDVQNRGKVAISMLPGNHSFLDGTFDRSFYATAPDSTMSRVSRFEDIFEQMRKKFQLEHGAPNRIFLSDCGGQDRSNDSMNLSSKGVDSQLASESSGYTTPSALFRHPSSAGTRPNASLEATPDSKNYRVQDILQVPSWRSPYKASQEDEFQTVSTNTGIGSDKKTDALSPEEIAEIFQAEGAVDPCEFPED